MLLSSLTELYNNAKHAKNLIAAWLSTQHLIRFTDRQALYKTPNILAWKAAR